MSAAKAVPICCIYLPYFDYVIFNDDDIDDHDDDDYDAYDGMNDDDANNDNDDGANDDNTDDGGLC